MACAYGQEEIVQCDEAKNLGAELPARENGVASVVSSQEAPDAADDARADPFRFFTEWSTPADEEAFKDL